MNTLDICGHHLNPGQWSDRILNTDSSDGQLFIIGKDDFYLSNDGRLFKLPRGGQGDGISAPRIATIFGRDHGGDDWLAGWIHDGGYRFWLMIWDDAQQAFVKWDKAHGRSKKACDDLLHECGIGCGDTEPMANVLYWAVAIIGKRSYQMPDF